MAKKFTYTGDGVVPFSTGDGDQAWSFTDHNAYFETVDVDFLNNILNVHVIVQDANNGPHMKSYAVVMDTAAETSTKNLINNHVRRLLAVQFPEFANGTSTTVSDPK